HAALSVHVHFLGVMGEVGSQEFSGVWRVAKELCAVFQCHLPGPPLARIDMEPALTPIFGLDLDLPTGGHEYGQGRHPVLVDVCKLIENPEGGQIAVRLPSMVWLQGIHQCLITWGKPLETTASPMSDKSRNVSTDREHVTWGGGLAIHDDQLPNQIVEGGPH